MALTKNDLQAINNLLTPIREEQKRQGEQLGHMQTDVNSLKSGQTRLETAQAQIKSTIEAVTAGGQTLATKADVQDMIAELKIVKRRVENLEEETGTPNPYKH